MYKPTEIEITIYTMSAAICDKYNQQNTSKNIKDEALLWIEYFPTLSQEQLCDKAVEFTRKNVIEMGWKEDDIDGVTWFLGFYAHVILTAKLSNNFENIMKTALRKYYYKY